MDTPTTEYGLRQQALGENVDTWGDDKLNEVIRDVAQILGRIKDIAITGDYTPTTTNYVDTADNKNRGWRFTGTLTAQATITVAASRAIIIVENATTGGFGLNVKTNAGTGIVVPAGRIAFLYCNAVNVVNIFPTHMGTSFTPSANGDATNKLYVDTAIAAAAIPGANGTIKVDALATAGYAISVLLAGTGIVIDDGGDTMTWRVDTTALAEFLAITGTVTATISSGTTAMVAKRRYRVTATATATLPTMNAGDFVIVELPVAANNTATIGRNSQTIDGVAADDTYMGDGTTAPTIRYDYASAGAVTSRLIEGIPA